MDHQEIKSEMLNTTFKRSTVKQAFFMLITLWIYVSIGVSRSYVSLLFYQLELPGSKLQLNDDEKTWIATCVGLLSPFSSLASGIFMDALGRKRCVQLMFVPFVLSWIIISISSTYTLLLIGMIIESIGLGMGICIITYVSEISTTEYRGLLLALVDVTFNFGVIFCNLLMYFLKWYTVSIIFTICTGISLLLTLKLPESPLWLYSKGKKEKAIRLLCDIRCKEANELEDEIKDLEKSYLTQTQKTGFIQTIKNCANGWRQFSIASFYFILLLLAGPLLTISYNVIILDYLKIPYDSALITVIYSIAAFVGSLMTPYMVHNSKRKTLVAFSAGGMALSMLVIGVYEEIFYYKNEKLVAWIIPVALCMYGSLCNLGVMPVGFVIGGELFPIEARGALQGIFGFLITCSWTLSLKFYPLVLFDLGIRTLIWTFLFFSTLLTLFAIFILPETQGKTLIEIQEQYFSKGKKDVKNLQV